MYNLNYELMALILDPFNSIRETAALCLAPVSRALIIVGVIITIRVCPNAARNLA
jgi:hypothetical protein